MTAILVVLFLLLSGCGSGGDQGNVETTSTQLLLVFNPQEAAQLEQTVPAIARIDVTISAPDLGTSRTTSVQVTNATSGQEIPLTINNAPVGSNRTVYLAAFDAANNKLFSGSTSGVSLPSASPVSIVVSLPFRVTIAKQGDGSGTVTSSPPGIECGSDCLEDFDAGLTVMLTAAADPGSAFAGWSGGGCSGTGSCTVSSNATITARFNAVASTATLNVTKSGSGIGTVISTPSGISCGISCSASFVSGSSVTLTATAAGGSTFAGWNGGGCSGTGPCVVMMNGNQTVNAEFTAAPTTALLSVAKSGGGNGTVTSTPSGIDCGATCSANFTSGSSVTLNAAPTGGATFAGWSGGGCSGTGACVVVMNGNQTVTATFNPPPSMDVLTVTKTGTGTGTVTSAPAGIDCGSVCSASFTSGSLVTLTATPAAGSTFTGWSGGGCSGVGGCVVTMNGAQTVNADFTVVPNVNTLAVTKSGTGNGTVTSTPAGIDCGAICTANFLSGTSVTLTAVAGVGSTFVGWTGEGCSGTGPCTVSMTANRTVSAEFSLLPTMATLTVNYTGLGTGTVTSTPPGLSCTSTCATAFPIGTVVTLTAAPAVGSTFSGWSGGGCSGTAACTVVLTADQAVAAQFDLAPTAATLTVSKAGNGSGLVTSSPSGIDCGTTCVSSFAIGTIVTLTAIPDSGSQFADWNGGGCNGTGACVVNVNSSLSVTARFSQNG